MPGLAETRTTEARARSLFAGLPLIFEPNQGQADLDPTDSRARFVTRGSGYSLFLGSQGAILSTVSRNVSHDSPKQNSKKHQAGSAVRVNSLEMKLAGANPNATMSGTEQLPGKSNYFIGNDPAKWRAGVPQFARVRYDSIYPGINLVFYGNQGHLEYDFQVAPGSDPSQAELEFHGAKQVELSEGALVIKREGGSVRLDPPRVYQEIAGRQQPVEGSFVLRGHNRAGFAIGSYDRSRELIIDPILTFSTYFGGSLDEHATQVAVDGSFNIFLAGSTTSPNLPAATGVFQTTLGGSGPNVYVAKITQPSGAAATLSYVTYLGGNGEDVPVGLKLDGRSDPFVAGTTSSTNFPTTPTNAYQKVPEPGSVGTSHVFVTELQFDGTKLLYSSYLSGNNTDVASGMTLDAAGNVYVTGTTMSTDTANPSTGIQFPASTIPEGLAFQTISNAGIQFFVTKVSTNAPGVGSIAYSTYFGGATSDTSPPVAVGGGIAVDTNGNVYFSGTTNFLYTGCSSCSTTDFPILNAYQACLDQAPLTNPVNPPLCTTSTTTTDPDAFVAKLNPNGAQGAQLIWSTYLGGTGTDSSTGVALDTGAANVYVVGTTNSTDIGQSTSTLTTSASYQRCLDAPTTPSGTTCPTTFNTTPPPNDAFVARLSNPARSTTNVPVDVALNYFSYLGGSDNEAGNAITVDSNSGALVTGWTQSPDFPVLPNPNSIQSTLNGPQDAFVARLNTAAVSGQTTSGSWANYFGGSGTDSGTSITLDVNQDTYLAGDTNSTDLHVAKPLQATNNGGYDAFVTHLGTAVNLSISGVLTLGTNQTFISAGNQATFTYTITNNGPDLATNITVTDSLNQLVTGVPLTFVSASISSGTCGGVTTNAIVSCSLPSLQSGSTATVTIVVTPTPNSNGSSPESFNGGTVQVSGLGNIVYAQTSVPAQMSDFSMNVSPRNQSVPAAGQTASYQVQLTPEPLYTGTIALSCSNLPTGATCGFSPSSPTLQSSSGVTAVLSISTTARPIVTPAASLLTRHDYAFWWMLPGLTLVGVGVGGGRRRRRILGMLMLCALFALLLGLPACSKNTTQAPVSGTPSGNWTVTVTAASGADSKSQTVTLYVP
jgi:uncharacterized repeat protein (TIGR01451 family)